MVGTAQRTETSTRLSVYEEILLGARVIMEPGNVYEVRVIDGGRDKTVSGYFSSPEAVAKEVLKIDKKYPAVYATLNPVAPELIARSFNRLRPWTRETTSDKQIASRKRVLIDFDPIRASGISSSDAEKELALQAAMGVREYFEPVLGLPVLADSGNGYHLLYRFDRPNNGDSDETVKRILEAAGKHCGVGGVNVDSAVFNAARLTKQYGTFVCKGDDFHGLPGIPARPHRRSRVLEVPPDWFASSTAAPGNAR